MNRPTLLAALAAPAIIWAQQAAQPEKGFEAVRVAHTGRVRVDGPAELAFQLFTAPGERLWADGWDPVVLSGGDGREKGSVFITGSGEDLTIWVVMDYNPESLHALYARVTPASRAGTVEVTVHPDGQGDAVAEVSYDLTGLSRSGNAMLADFDARRYSRMMRDWQQAIRGADIDLVARFAQ